MLTLKPDPNMPEQNVHEQPKGWSQKAWAMYQKVYETLKPLRGGHLNVVSTFAAMGLGPESCILKLAYILYTHDGEDDYPYLPQHCGAGFASAPDSRRERSAPPVPFGAVRRAAAWGGAGG